MVVVVTSVWLIHYYTARFDCKSSGIIMELYLVDVLAVGTVSHHALWAGSTAVPRGLKGLHATHTLEAGAG